MRRCTDKGMDERMDAWMDGWMDRWMDKYISGTYAVGKTDTEIQGVRETQGQNRIHTLYIDSQERQKDSARERERDLSLIHI